MFENIYHILGLTVSPILLCLCNTQSSDKSVVQTTFSSTQIIFLSSTLHLRSHRDTEKTVHQRSRKVHGLEKHLQIVCLEKLVDPQSK